MPSTLLKSYWPAIIWSAIVFILLILPGSAFPKENFLTRIQFDKWVHIGLFGVLTWLYCWGLHVKSNTIYKVRSFTIITILCVVFGYVMELVQKKYVPNRSYDWGDVIADAIGAILGLIISIKLYSKK